MSRRGVPSEIYSDRGTNFIGACKELKEARKHIDEEIVADKLNSTQRRLNGSLTHQPAHTWGCVGEAN